MRHHAIRNFTLLSLLLIVTAGTVSAQSTRNRIDIPFNFTVGQHSLPAGTYTVEPLKRDSRNVWMLQNKAGNVNILFITIPVWNGKTQGDTRLVFNKYEGRNFLAQIWSAGESSGRELLRTKWERQVAKNGVQPEQVAVISESRLKR
ncbi:MAG TPA: hypothetical protein VGN86_17655 [Pyrinomonadaceae bacterium]|jgi:hypothetical protein|nr:hypothetical protein [Pyrinomonadaceae bacterium]